MIQIKDTKEGHRKRLRQRFIEGGLDGFLDYEIIELLLTLGTPRKDCKQMAKEAISSFGGLRNVLDASFEELQGVSGIGPSNAFGIKLFQAVSVKYAKEKIPKADSFSNPLLISNYVRAKIGREKKEHFYILILDARNSLIKDLDISVGTLNANLIHPREVFKEVIQASGAKIIIAHNHPSNDPTASPEDVAITRRLWEASKIFDIDLLDHVVVTKDNFFSFKEKGLL